MFKRTTQHTSDTWVFAHAHVLERLARDHQLAVVPRGVLELVPDAVRRLHAGRRVARTLRLTRSIGRVLATASATYCLQQIVGDVTFWR